MHLHIVTINQILARLSLLLRERGGGKWGGELLLILVINLCSLSAIVISLFLFHNNHLYTI